jgi:calcium-dependent protein kinase
LKHAVGTPYFICPEMIRGEYDEKCDIWSIGVILYYMLSGKYPFNSEDNYEIFQKIETEQPSFWELNVSEDAIDFIGRCLRKNPKLRPSAKECLFHPWLEPIFTCIRSNSFLSENLITNFATYTKCPQLKKLILKYLISNMGHIELSPYKSAFYAFDFKNEGIVTVKDIKKIFDVYSLKITNSQIKKIMSICNEPNKRYLTYTEFILCCINIGDILTPEKLINAFFFFDMDNNLVIDSTDLKNVLLRCGKSVINEKDIDKILLEATKEKDNKIGIEEFIKMYKDDIDVDEYINAINILLENNTDIRNFL